MVTVKYCGKRYYPTACGSKLRTAVKPSLFCLGVQLTMDMTLIDRLLGSDAPYITYAVPVFFLLIGIELLAARFEGKRYYRLNDSINDLSCGIIERLLVVFIQTGLFAGYIFIYRHFALLDMENLSPAGKWVAAIALLFGVDLCFYWFHRMAHELNLPWAAHSVHHQSEEYNLTVALRQGAFEPAVAWVFYLPLALIGFPPLWFLAMSSFNTLYQFWVHTRLIGKLGPLEWVMNTPSHHRVHHGRNPKYLDTNYAGMFIIWDRMFGTFQPEEEEPVYGVTRPLATWNPIWANLQELYNIYQKARQARHWWDKVRIWFMPTGWCPEGVEPGPPAPEVTAETVQKYDPPLPRSLRLYALVQFVVALCLGTWVLVLAGSPERSMSTAALVVWALVVTATLVALGALLDRRRWALRADLARLAVTAVWVALFTWGRPWAGLP